MQPDMVITNGRMRGDALRRFDLVPKHSDPEHTDPLLAIAIQDGRIAAVEPLDTSGTTASGTSTSRAAASGATISGTTREAPAPWSTREIIDAAGGLLSEPFVNGHLHLCKVYTLDQLGDGAIRDYHGGTMGGAMTAIELAAAVKKNYAPERLLPGIRRALRLAIANGISHIRAFADTDTTAGLIGIDAVMQGRDEFSTGLTVQAVAFPQDGVLRDDGAEALVRQALERGADAVGGIPWIEFTEADARDHVVRMLDLAVEFDRDVSMLVDDAGDAGLRTLETLAVETDRRGRHGRVTAQHARAMALYPEPYFRKLLALLKKAGIGVVSDPHTGPLHARVRDLRAAGIPVGLGQDDITDAYYPFGRNNMLEVAFLAAHLLWMTSAEDLEGLYEMVTVDAARVLGISDFELKAGGPANLVVHRTGTVRDVLREHAAPRWVIRGGRVIAREGTVTGSFPGA